MNASRQIVMATKRAPVEYERAASGELVVSLSPGGTASVVADQARYLDVSWFASALTESDAEVAAVHADGVDVDLGGKKPLRLHLLRHDPAVFDPVQYHFANETLWLTHHSLWDGWRTPTFDERTRHEWECFLAFSEDFASALVAAAHAEPMFLLHDFQLLYVPRLLRERAPGARILAFSHSAWPPADVWRMTPRYMRTGLVEAMLHADVVGFFAQRWVTNFLACVVDCVPEAEVDHARRSVRYEGRTTTVRALPLGYSPAALAERRSSFPDELARWVESASLVVHSGRTDPIKNAPRAIQAFRQALGDGQQIDARLLVKMNPNRLYVDANAEYVRATEACVGEANDALGFEAVRLVVDNDVALTLGSFERADLILLNSVIDGMNLSAFEGTIVNDRAAELVLSETSGAAEQLADVATIVSAFDVAEQAAAIAEALRLPADERRRRHEARRARSLEFTLERWVDAQLSALEDVD